MRISGIVGQSAALRSGSGEASDVSSDRQRRQLALARALHFHHHAADQGNVNSLLRIGDAHYYGLGTPADLNKSVAVYRQVSVIHNNDYYKSV